MKRTNVLKKNPNKTGKLSEEMEKRSRLFEKLLR